MAKAFGFNPFERVVDFLVRQIGTEAARARGSASIA
jgi:hypothetical protein